MPEIVEILATARGMTPREYLRRFTLRESIRHFRAWSFDRTLAMRPFLEIIDALLGSFESDAEDVGEEVSPPSAQSARPAQEPVTPAKKKRKVKRTTAQVQSWMKIPAGAAVFDLDGDVGPIAMISADPQNLESVRAWRTGQTEAAHLKPVCRLDDAGNPHLIPPK